MNEERAQVAVETLLIIIGALVVVTIVSLFIKNAADTTGSTVTETAAKP